jgi:hypothetical protein
MAALKLPETPEEIELRRKQEELSSFETALANEELSLATLRTEVRQFEREYASATAHLFAKLDALNATIAEREAARRRHDPAAQEAAAKSRQQAAASAAAVEIANRESEPRRPSARAKELYRMLAKRAHPDLVTDEKERLKRTTIMAKINAAYERGDEEELHRILTDLETSPESVRGDGVAADLVRVIRRIHQAQRRLATIESEKDGIRISPMCELLNKVRDARQKGIDHVGDICRELQRQIETAERRI